MNDLYDENGNEIGLFALCNYIVQTYPEDIFVNEPKEIIILRDTCKKILIKRR